MNGPIRGALAGGILLGCGVALVLSSAPVLAEGGVCRKHPMTGQYFCAPAGGGIAFDERWGRFACVDEGQCRTDALGEARCTRVVGHVIDLEDGRARCYQVKKDAKMVKDSCRRGDPNKCVHRPGRAR